MLEKINAYYELHTCNKNIEPQFHHNYIIGGTYYLCDGRIKASDYVRR